MLNINDRVKLVHFTGKTELGYVKELFPSMDQFVVRVDDEFRGDRGWDDGFRCFKNSDIGTSVFVI
jgi:hypothetical protein